MKKQIGACILASSLLMGGAFADPEMKVSAGFKLPFAAIDYNNNKKGSTTFYGDVANWDASEDFKFDFHNESAGIIINLKPKTNKTMDLDEYSAWFSPMNDLRVSFGTSGERHWFKGVDERVNNKPGEFSIIDCDDDSKTGLYYGIIGATIDKDTQSSFKGGTLGTWGGTRNTQYYGWNSSEIGAGDNGGVSLRAVYGNQENGFFAKAGLVNHDSKWNNPYSNMYENNDEDKSYWASEIQGEAGYAWDTGSIELIYKTPRQGNNVAAVYYQPRLLDGNLLGTLGLTFANDTSKGHSKNHDANEFTAFAVDARFQYNVSEKLKTFLYFNYSQINVGDENKLFSVSDGKYTDGPKAGKSADAEQSLYAVASVGYTLPVGYINVDGGLYMRDLDDNDGKDRGENFTTVKASWTKWFNGSGLSLGGSWYHALNTSDADDDFAKDHLRLGAYFEVWLNN